MVPRFTSFRPKPKPPSQQAQPVDRAITASPRSEPQDEREKTSAHAQPESHRRHRHHGRHKHQKSSRLRTESAEAAVALKDASTPSTVVPWAEVPELYTVDKEGDANNLVYGTLHRYSIPLYLRRGAGSVIGLPQRYKIDREANTERDLVISDRSDEGTRRREKYVFARNERKHIRRLRIRPVEQTDLPQEVQEDFVHLSVGRGKKRKRGESDGSSSSPEREEHYRSIEGKAKSGAAPSDGDLQYASESSASDYEMVSFDNPSATARQRNIELTRVVDVQPTNPQAWIDLIDHQDGLLGAGNSSAPRALTTAERRSTADIKLSMYEKALEKTRSGGNEREQLLLGMMEEGSKIWE